jgi:hypothetical protein
MDEIKAIIIALVISMLLFVLYFLPAFIAKSRKHRNLTGVTLLNLFLGWTFLGWIVALIWSCINGPESRRKV